MKHSQLIWMVLLSTCCLWLSTAQASTGYAENTHEITLDNGLKVIVKEDHRAPVAVFQIWYRVGSMDEPRGMTGVSHVLEHMMYKGTPSIASGRFSKIVAEKGGQENAFTTPDYTGYYQVFPADQVELSFRLEADRMQNLILRQEDFDKEREVVIEERRMRIDDNPNALTYEHFRSTLFTASPYRHPVIGWRHDIEQLTLDDLKSWYKTWYAPNNATLIIVGDVDAETMFKLAKTYFGAIKRTSIQIHKPYQEVTPLGTKRIAVKAPAKLPFLIKGYPAPVLKTTPEAWEPYALELLEGILSSGGSSRFNRHLVREKSLAAQIYADYNPVSRLENVFLVAAVPNQGVAISAIEDAIDDEIKKLQTTLITPEELQRVKRVITANHVFAQDSLSHQARLLGTLETAGLSWTLLDDYLEKLNAISPEQIQAVAKRYLNEDLATIAQLIPTSLEPTQQEPLSHE